MIETTWVVLGLASAGLVIRLLAWDNKNQREGLSVLQSKVKDWEIGSIRIKEALGHNFQDAPFIHEAPNTFCGEVVYQINNVLQRNDYLAKDLAQKKKDLVLASITWADDQKLIASQKASLDNAISERDNAIHEMNYYQDIASVIADEKKAASDLANCYLLSRNQARDDIQGIKQNYTKIHPESVQFDAIFGDIGKKSVPNARQPKVVKKTTLKPKKTVSRGK